MVLPSRCLCLDGRSPQSSDSNVIVRGPVRHILYHLQMHKHRVSSLQTKDRKDIPAFCFCLTQYVDLFIEDSHSTPVPGVPHTGALGPPVPYRVKPKDSVT